MSSSAGLSRTRSLRNPQTRSNVPAYNEPGSPSRVRGEATRTVSPSRLPTKPPAIRPSGTATTTLTSSTAPRTKAPTTVASRHISTLSSSSRAPSSKTAAHDGALPATSSSTKPLGRAPSVRQAPPLTSSSRIAGTARPKSSGGPPPTTAPGERQLGHSRAKSTVTSLTSATTLRLLSSKNPSPPASVISTSSTSTTATRPSTRSQTQSLQTSHVTRAQAPSTTTTSTLASRRPAFNTNQQHYSPAKSLAPKPLTSTFLAPPSPSKQPVNILITAETSRLQTELLQLSLLHRDANAVTTAWHESARSKLGARFEELVIADRDLRALERDSAEASAVADLIRWGQGEKGTDLGLDEKIQILDQVLNGVWQLGEQGGRYQRTVSAFDEWAERVKEIRTAQRRNDVDALLDRGGGIADDGEGGLFVSDLDACWKQDYAGLVRMLEGWRRLLNQLGDVPDDETDKVSGLAPKKSGLKCMVEGCRALVHDMLKELEIMDKIERDAISAEEDWIEMMSARLKEAEHRKPRRKEDVPPWKLLVL
ncbi:hypothetical protein GGR57DRAFT_447422 [Xylariaceae sp. FL1272]|nr:hypothetical protein GGR57DRAFT_447422 [Xylariaceae sp. FL1272]